MENVVNLSLHQEPFNLQCLLDSTVKLYPCFRKCLTIEYLKTCNI